MNQREVRTRRQEMEEKLMVLRLRNPRTLRALPTLLFIYNSKKKVGELNIPNKGNMINWEAIKKIRV